MFFGSVQNQDIRQLWGSEKSRQKRETFLTNEGATACEKCYFRSDNKPTIVASVPLQALPDDIEVSRPMKREALLALLQSTQFQPTRLRCFASENRHTATALHNKSHPSQRFPAYHDQPVHEDTRPKRFGTPVAKSAGNADQRNDAQESRV